MSLSLSNVLLYRTESGWHYTLYFHGGQTLTAPVVSLRPGLVGLRALAGEIRRDLATVHRFIPTEGWLRIEGDPPGWVMRDPHARGAVPPGPAPSPTPPPRRRATDRAPERPSDRPSEPPSDLSHLHVRH